MKKSKVLIYDGSFNGFLTAIFIAFDKKIAVADIRKNKQVQNGLFSEVETVFTQMDKAKRVWNGIQNKNHSAIKNIYFAFLSESKGIEWVLFRYIQKLFKSADSWQISFDEEPAKKIAQFSKVVGMEKLRIENSLRFDVSSDGIYFANISPDYNVLPLISKYFRSRYPNKEWLIYDTRRKYGLHYNGLNVEIISIDLREMYADAALKSSALSEDILGITDLHNTFFKNTAVKQLFNRKLHKQTIAKRYSNYSRGRTAV